MVQLGIRLDNVSTALDLDEGLEVLNGPSTIHRQGDTSAAEKRR
jgi:hypothetical protein